MPRPIPEWVWPRETSTPVPSARPRPWPSICGRGCGYSGTGLVPRSVSCPDPVRKYREGNWVHSLLQSLHVLLITWKHIFWDCKQHTFFDAQLCYMCSLDSHMKSFMKLLHDLTLQLLHAKAISLLPLEKKKRSMHLVCI